VTAPPRNLAGGLWIVVDMGFALSALSIVKALGLGYPPVQLVFLRAAVGLALMLPWIVARREAFGHVVDLPLHALRAVLSAITLTASFFAIARIPLALFTAINFTRPFMLMLMAALILHERIGRRRWVAAGIGFSGVLVAVSPGTRAWDWGVGALLVAVVTGSGAVILTRRLRMAPAVVLMAFYTAGLLILTLPLAWAVWTPVPAGEWPALLAIGVLSQSGQFCFLNAHRLAEAGFLAVLGYLSLVLSTLVGYAVFSEVPTPSFWVGAALIIAATLTASPLSRSARTGIVSAGRTP
jgi:S-adenosylmethionine uptake transporter